MEIIWRAVSEDFWPFDIDVTTNPPVGAQWNTSNYLRLAIGGNGAWVGGPGGISYIDMVNQAGAGFYQPTFVFPQNLGPNIPKYVWEAVSHEAGHWFGLQHDGVRDAVGYTVTEYYQGSPGGNGNSLNAAVSWAPIMGTAYWASISQWSKGEYPMANNQEDDMGRLSMRIGWAPTSVPTGATIDTAVALPLSGGGTNSATVSGSVTAATLRNASDVHVYSFAAAPGTVTVTCDVLNAYNNLWQRSNLNCQVRVLGQTGTEIGVFNPSGTTTPTGLGTGQQTVTLTTGGT
ncbi:hypothetical protein OEZ85_011415 [Tetradesmus obliquus]|uniref:Peptidase M43 pregnancy-associated plasma-A domain-containing protein n=1 Tax=Tetradesmus obliquus TaxID=3088 RepID=A0ABY8TQK2_TETOB|nr:hypothetical protein OEZ85_011415 [Tetradesmus obliquus]